MPKIILAILSQIDSQIMANLGQSLAKTFCCPVEIRHQLMNLDFAYDDARKQYTSPLVLARLRRMKKGSSDKIMAVTDVDLYSTGYDFVYGEADIKAGIASLSVSRLHDGNPDVSSDLSLATERIIREATHEIGHLFGLGHCRDRQCVMCTCTCLAEVDAAHGGLCPECNKKLKPQL